MESKIRVEHDFGTGQTWLQFYVQTTNPPGTQPDLRDLALKTFIEKASDTASELYLSWPPNNSDNSVVQIMVRQKENLNWVGLNAKCLISDNENFKPGNSYNLLMATGNDHKVYIKGIGHIVRHNDLIEYNYLYEFAKCWDINDIGRWDAKA